jgi:hypothetical protein
MNVQMESTLLRILREGGGWNHGLHLRIENLPYMASVIEATDESGPCGLPASSVAHYGELNGDTMRDPRCVSSLTSREGRTSIPSTTATIK